MNTVQNYIVRQETMMFLPTFDEFGNLSTHVIEIDGDYKVDMKPAELMNHCLGYYGASLRGALDGAKAILGKVRMRPVVMSEKLELYWFSSKSNIHEDCIWFALQHVREYEGVSSTETEVTLSNGLRIVVDVSMYRFKERIQRAYQLKGKLEERSKWHFLATREMKASYQIRRPMGVLNYEIEEVPK